MKFTVPVQSIINPLVQVASICAKNTSNPDDLTKFLLVDVKHTALTLTGTDNSVQMQAVVPLSENSCDSEGTFLIGSDRIAAFVKSLNMADDVSFDLDEEEEMLAVVSGKSDFKIRVRLMAADTVFPVFKEEEGAPEPQQFLIEESKLRYMLDKSVFCVSHENYRDYLKGVRFEITGDELVLYALDGHRMAALETKLPAAVENEIKFLMTLRGVTELQKLLSNSSKEQLKFTVSDKFISTQIGFYTISNRLLTCKYPNVAAVLPKMCSPELHVPLEELKNDVRRVSLFSNKRLNHINLTFTYNKLQLFSQNSDHEIGRAVIDIDYPEQDGYREINLNAEYLKDFLNAIDTSDVVFGFSPPYQNTLIRQRDEWNENGVRVRYVVSHIMV